MRVVQKIRTHVSSYYTSFSEIVILRDFARNTRAQSKEIFVVLRFVVVVLLLSSYKIFVSLAYFPMDFF